MRQRQKEYEKSMRRVYGKLWQIYTGEMSKAPVSQTASSTDSAAEVDEVDWSSSGEGTLNSSSENAYNLLTMRKKMQ